MSDAKPVHRALKWVFGVLAALIALVLLLIVAVLLVDANRLRAPLERFVAARSHRQVQIAGPLEIHLLSRNPAITARRITLGNPPWTPAGTFAEIGQLSMSFELPGLTRPFAIHRLELRDTTLYLRRDETGLANWQWGDPRQGRGLAKGLPLIRGLTTSNLHVELVDERRHLRFSGSVSAQDRRDGHDGLRILGQGHLNGRPAVFDLDGDALGSVSRKKPYRFAFAERSSGSRLTSEGLLPRPLDVRYFNATFRAAGADLKDLYFLTGLRLIDTGKYSLSGKVTRNAKRFRYDDLRIESGKSDLTGSVSIDASSLPSRLEAQLHSKALHLSDLGKRAAGRAPVAQPNSGLLPRTPLNLIGVRRRNMRIHFEADEILARKIFVQSVSADLSVDRNVLDGTLRSAKLLQGRLQGHLRFDASGALPTARLSFTATKANLEQLDSRRAGTDHPASPPVLNGMLAARVSLSGRGHSIHELAASASGNVDIALSHGAIRKSLAELAGIDLRGLGLMLARNHEQTEARCGVASFAAQKGVFTAQTLLLDTEPVLIDGSGSINLASETIDMTIRGHPKHLRLRLRAPLTIQGDLRHPVIRMAARSSLGQAGAAAALGVLLTPFAAALALVDPGLTKDADCAQLVGTAHEDAAQK